MILEFTEPTDIVEMVRALAFRWGIPAELIMFEAVKRAARFEGIEVAKIAELGDMPSFDPLAPMFAPPGCHYELIRDLPGGKEMADAEAPGIFFDSLAAFLEIEQAGSDAEVATALKAKIQEITGRTDWPEEGPV